MTGSWTDGRLGRQRAGVGVERRRYADRHGQLVAAVADRQPAEHRDAEPGQMLAQHVHNGGRPVVGAVGELAHGDAGDAVQDAGPAQVEQHPVHFVRWLGHLLEQQDRAPQVRHVDGAHGGRQQAQVAAQQRAAGRGRAVRTGEVSSSARAVTPPARSS